MYLALKWIRVLVIQGVALYYKPGEYPPGRYPLELIYPERKVEKTRYQPHNKNQMEYRRSNQEDLGD